jgi:hypothetical protein
MLGLIGAYWLGRSAGRQRAQLEELERRDRRSLHPAPVEAANPVVTILVCTAVVVFLLIAL